MAELDALPGDITVQPSVAGANVNVNAAASPTAAGSVSIKGGDSDVNSPGGVFMRGGAGANAGADVSVRGGTASTGTGGGAQLRGGDAINTGGAYVFANGGAAGAGDGGDLFLVAGSPDGGRDGVIRLLGPGETPLPTADPMVVDALWNSSGFVKVSAAT